MSENQGFHANYANIIAEQSLLSITRLLASDLSKNPYMSIAQFLKNTSDSDIEHLLNIIEEGEDHDNFGDLMLLSIMLAAAEGCEGQNIDEYTANMNSFNAFIVCESLYRKGLVKLYRENMSFGDDMKNALIIEKFNEND